MRTTVLTTAATCVASAILLITLNAGKPRMTQTTDCDRPAQSHDISPADTARRQTATFGSGCFWCTEGIFQQLKGVHSVVSGYSGGHVANPTYKQVCSGTTGHAEVVQVSFDPALISYTDLLHAFWQSHDPTALNRQGNDVGTQYRSVVFYHDDEQRQLAEHYKRQLDESGSYNRPIVTEIVPFLEFFAAENYHQNYADLNPQQPYCQFVIRPKIEKFKKAFKDKLKP